MFFSVFEKSFVKQTTGIWDEEEERIKPAQSFQRKYTLHLDFDDWKSYMEKMRIFLLTGEPPPTTDIRMRDRCRKAMKQKRFSIKDGVLFYRLSNRKLKVVETESERDEIIKKAHQGVIRVLSHTKMTILTEFYWKGIQQDILNYREKHNLTTGQTHHSQPSPESYPALDSLHHDHVNPRLENIVCQGPKDTSCDDIGATETVETLGSSNPNTSAEILDHHYMIDLPADQTPRPYPFQLHPGGQISKSAKGKTNKKSEARGWWKERDPNPVKRFEGWMSFSKALTKYLSTGKFPIGSNKVMKDRCKKSKSTGKYTVEDGDLFYCHGEKKRKVIHTVAERDEILEKAHDIREIGHVQKLESTIENIRSKYYWKGFQYDVFNYREAHNVKYCPKVDAKRRQRSQENVGVLENIQNVAEPLSVMLDHNYLTCKPIEQMENLPIDSQAFDSEASAGRKPKAYFGKTSKVAMTVISQLCCNNFDNLGFVLKDLLSGYNPETSESAIYEEWSVPMNQENHQFWSTFTMLQKSKRRHNLVSVGRLLELMLLHKLGEILHNGVPDCETNDGGRAFQSTTATQAASVISNVLQPTAPVTNDNVTSDDNDAMHISDDDDNDGGGYVPDSEPPGPGVTDTPRKAEMAEKKILRWKNKRPAGMQGLPLGSYSNKSMESILKTNKMKSILKKSKMRSILKASQPRSVIVDPELVLAGAEQATWRSQENAVKPEPEPARDEYLVPLGVKQDAHYYMVLPHDPSDKPEQIPKPVHPVSNVTTSAGNTSGYTVTTQPSVGDDDGSAPEKNKGSKVKTQKHCDLNIDSENQQVQNLPIQGISTGTGNREKIHTGNMSQSTLSLPYVYERSTGKLYMQVASDTGQKYVQVKVSHKDYTCSVPKCNATFGTITEMDTHYYQTHCHLECKVCKKRFPSNRSLHIHLRRKHRGTLSETCTICGKRLHSPDMLKVHMLRHQGNMPYKCDICRKGFLRLHELKHHKKLHEDGKIPRRRLPSECKQCNRTFKVRSTYRAHMARHRGVTGSTVCPICGKVLSTTGSLNQHIKRHNQEMFPCHICGKEFVSSESLESHVNYKHTKLRPYTCEVCGKGYPGDRSVREHIRSYHPEYFTQISSRHTNIPSDKTEKADS